MFIKQFCLVILVVSSSIQSGQYARLQNRYNQSIETARLYTWQSLALLNSARDSVAHTASSIKGLPRVASDYALTTTYRFSAKNASERRKFVLQGAVLMSPISLSKKEAIYKESFPQIHARIVSPLPVIMFPVNESFLDPSTQLFIKKMMTNDAVIKGSLIHGRKNHRDQNGEMICGGYAGLPIELVIDILNYVGTAPQ